MTTSATLETSLKKIDKTESTTLIKKVFVTPLSGSNV